MGREDAAAILEAARLRTLESRGVRVRISESFDPPLEIEGKPAGDYVQEGVADLAGRRLHLVVVGGGWLERMAELLAERAPWLDDDDDDDDDIGELVHIGGVHYWGAGDVWTRSPDGSEEGPRMPGDPVWILEALAGASPSSVEEDPGSDVADPRYRARVEIARAARRLGTRFDPGYDRELVVEVGITPPGLINRVIWSSRYGTRRRPGLLERLIGQSRRDAVASPVNRPWRTLELWDFGLDVHIPSPTVASHDGPSLLRIAIDLWKRRRRWRKEHSSDTSPTDRGRTL